MFAAKFRIHSKKLIFKKAGKDLSKPIHSKKEAGSKQVKTKPAAIPFSKYHTILIIIARPKTFT
jgi:hypothetical protein